MIRAVVLAALLFATRAIAGVMVDDFTAGAIALQAPPTAAATQTGISGVAGGVRKWSYNTLGAAPAGSSVRMTVDTAAGAYHYQADSGLTAVNFTLAYDGGDVTNGMNLDLAANGATGLALDFAYANFPSGTGHLDITISSRTGGVDGSVYYYQAINNSASPFSVVLPFTPPPGSSYSGTLDPHHIRRISIGTGNGNLSGGDFVINSIHSVPEPSAAMVFMLCAFGLMRRRRSYFPGSSRL